MVALSKRRVFGTMVALAELAAAKPGVVSEPCHSYSASPIATAFAQWMIQTDPKKPFPTGFDLESEKKLETERAANDWANLCRWREDNRAILLGKRARPAVVFVGDSITENWGLAEPDFFATANANRGVSGQTTAQILVRFPEDVVALKPRVVHIMAGTNDIAGNGGPVTLGQVENRIAAMAELATANHIKVIIGSTLPARDFFWNPGVDPSRHIVELNEWIRAYAKSGGFLFVDYYAALSKDGIVMRPDLSNDGVHPNRNGYAVMRPLAENALSQVLQ